jgi:hypothetical protein
MTSGASGAHHPAASQSGLLAVAPPSVGLRGRHQLSRVVMPALAIAVSATTLVWFVSNPLFSAVLALLHTLRPGPLLLAVALVPILQWLRGWRFSILLQRSLDLPCRQHFKLAAHLSFLNLILPFKIGDFGFPLLARKTVGAPLLKGTVAILWCRLNDLFVTLAILSFCGAFLIAPDRNPGAVPALFALAVACLLLPLVLAPATRVLQSWPRLGALVARLPDGAQTRYGRGASLAVTIAIWSIHGLIGYLAVNAVADDVLVFAAAFAGAASNLAFALPVTGVAGLGPPQAAWAAALHFAGASWTIAIATALLAYGCILLGATLTVAPILAWRHDDGPGAHSLRRGRRRDSANAIAARALSRLARPRADAAGEHLAGAQRVGTGTSPR